MPGHLYAFSLDSFVYISDIWIGKVLGRRREPLGSRHCAPRLASYRAQPGPGQKSYQRPPRGGGGASRILSDQSRFNRPGPRGRSADARRQLKWHTFCRVIRNHRYIESRDWIYWPRLSTSWSSISHCVWMITLPCGQNLAIYFKEIEYQTRYECG
jgi:hypothetical protein